MVPLDIGADMAMLGRECAISNLGRSVRLSRLKGAAASIDVTENGREATEGRGACRTQ